MRHRKSGIKLNRTSSHRHAMFRNMVTSLFKYDRIKTTDVKAKELRRWADHMITLAKKGDLHSMRQALSIIREKDVVHKLFEGAADRFGSISGGYTRIIKLGRRPGDAAPVSLIELVTFDKKKDKPKKKKKQVKAEAAPKKGSDEKAVEEKQEAPEKQEAEAAADDPKETEAEAPEAETAAVKQEAAPAEEADDAAVEAMASETVAEEKEAQEAEKPEEEK